jgi:hypothetical protein
MSIVFAIDPGNIQSGYVFFGVEDEKIHAFGKDDNDVVIGFMRKNAAKIAYIAIEEIKGWGKIGDTIIQTCFWTGRFIQVAKDLGLPVTLIPRKSVITQLTGNPKANDKDGTDYLKARFEPGLKAKERPYRKLKGFKKDAWQALLLAVAFSDLRCPKRVQTTEIS